MGLYTKEDKSKHCQPPVTRRSRLSMLSSAPERLLGISCVFRKNMVQGGVLDGSPTTFQLEISCYDMGSLWTILLTVFLNGFFRLLIKVEHYYLKILS
uniref:Ovule protein n=1 Tax=Heterorhabditis bacteriophora TaxID=37862 RepID=A0A1I7XAY8_HETBA